MSRACNISNLTYLDDSVLHLSPIHIYVDFDVSLSLHTCDLYYRQWHCHIVIFLNKKKVVISIIFILDIHPINKKKITTWQWLVIKTNKISSLLAHKKNWMPRTNQNGAYFILSFIQGHEKSPTYNEPLLKICCLGSRWLDAPAGTF